MKEKNNGYEVVTEKTGKISVFKIIMLCILIAYITFLITAVSLYNYFINDDNAKKSFADYPAYDYAVNYGINNNLKKYKNGWYLPTASEAYELAENLETVQTSFKKCGVTDLQGIVWTSSQNYGAQENEFVVDLLDASVDIGFKEMEYIVYSIYCFAD